MKASLKDGFELEIDEKNLGDWEILEVFYDIDEGDTSKVVKVARMLFGKDGVQALKDHIRDEDGKTPINRMVAALQELIDSANSVKNS